MLHADPARMRRSVVPAAKSSAVNEIALTGVYEISKILTSASRLETTLSNVVNLLASFMQMRHGVIVLLDDDGVPNIVVGAGWSEESSERYRERMPKKAIGQVIATAMPFVVPNVAAHPLFEPADIAALGADDGATVSFIGVPIRIGFKVVGTLTIDRAFDPRSAVRLDFDVRFLVMIANLIGQTVELHRVLARDRARLIAESQRLQKQLAEYKPELGKPPVAGILGESKPIRALLEKLAIVAKSRSPVLLRGESGTGKELFAHAIHELSPCANGPFVKVNCAALPESVLESELFGHEKGAFTGAVAARKGRFELADGGTLFLDEIGEMSPAFQAKLLRVLQESEFERVGGSRTIKVNVRLVTATNKNLEEAVVKKEFRADLYYRVNVVSLMLPPLRERKSDIPLLAQEFLNRFNSENGREVAFGPGALEAISSCCFPGNVRELENCVRRTATLTEGPLIAAADLACRNDQCLSAVLWKSNEPSHAGRAPLDTAPLRLTDPLPVAPSESAADAAELGAAADGLVVARGDHGAERNRLIEAMERTGWVQAKAARLLGLTPRQIGYALKKHGIVIKRF
jgi:Nif-specific regulatory protein